MPTLSNMYVGSQAASRAYVGSTLAWEAAPPVEPLLFDDFERPNTQPTSLGDAPFTYVLDDGWYINNGAARTGSTTPASEYAIAQVPGGLSNFRVYGRMLPSEWDVFCYLVARYADNQGWDNVLFGGRRPVSGGGWESAIIAIVGGSQSTVATGPIGTTSVESDWEFVVDGDQASLWQDGTEVIAPTALPTGYPTGAWAGMATYNDNGFAEWGVYPLD